MKKFEWQVACTPLTNLVGEKEGPVQLSKDPDGKKGPCN